MEPVRAGRIAATVLVVAGVGVAFLDLAMGIIALATGAGLALVSVGGRSVHPHGDLADLLADLKLQGPGHHVPIPDGIRLFVPADPRGPHLIPDVAHGAVQRDPPGSVGLALDAPCKELLDAWRQMEGLPIGQGAAEGAAHVRRALPRLDLASNVHVDQQGESFRIRLRLRDAGPAIAAQESGWDLQGGVPAASLASALMALALKRPMRTASSQVEPDGTLHLEVVAGTTV